MTSRLKRLMPWLLVGIFSSLAFFPAYGLVGKLEDLTQGRVKALDSSGTVWKGRAALGLSDGGQMRMIPGELTWDWQLFGKAGLLALEIQHPNLSAPLTLGLNGLTPTVSPLQARIPAAWLNALGAPFNTIKPEGLLVINGEALKVTDPTFRYSIDWQDAQSALTSIRPLGKYVITVEGYGSERFDIDIQTKSGPLYVQAKGGIGKEGAFQFNGQAWPSEDSRTALTGILSQMGRYNDGKYQLGTFR